MKPKIFIGSSTEGLEVARAVEVHLDCDAEVTVWKDGVFGLGKGTLESIVMALEQFDFAVLVLTPDDMITSRDITFQSPRDNVLLELGLFIGRLGRERTFIVLNRDYDIKLPSDLAGVSMADFGNREDNNILSALAPACTKIRYAIKSHGTFTDRNIRGNTDPNIGRPIVTARVTTHAEGNLATALDLTVHNTGNSPAKNVKLLVNEAELEASLSSNILKEDVLRCFSKEGIVPVLENGQQVTNNFGILTRNSDQSTWKANTILNVNISYQDLEGNEYQHDIPLKLASDSGFAGSFWKK